MKQRLVCGACGVPVGLWGRVDGSTYYKHHSGWHGRKTCGKPPVPVEHKSPEQIEDELRAQLRRELDEEYEDYAMARGLVRDE